MEEEHTNAGWERFDDKLTATGISGTPQGAKSETPLETGRFSKEMLL
jgi:hypothetical protein